MFKYLMWYSKKFLLRNSTVMKFEAIEWSICDLSVWHWRIAPYIMSWGYCSVRCARCGGPPAEPPVPDEKPLQLSGGVHGFASTVHVTHDSVVLQCPTRSIVLNNWPTQTIPLRDSDLFHTTLTFKFNSLDLK